MKNTSHSLVLFFSLYLLVSTGVAGQPDTNNKNITGDAESVDTDLAMAPQTSADRQNIQLLATASPLVLPASVGQLADHSVSLLTSPQAQLSTLPQADKTAITMFDTISADTIRANKTRANKTIVKQPDTIHSVAGRQVAKIFSNKEIAHLRQLFLQAENYLKQADDDNYFLLANQLKDYPLYPYLQYQWLKKHLDSDYKIKHFLTVYQSSRYADILKRKWLYHLAKYKRWQTFLHYYTPTGEVALSCYYQRAQFNSGYKQLALKAAAKLWAVGHSQPAACDPLFSRLEQSSLFNQTLLWQRFDVALDNNKTRLAIYVKKKMAAAYQPTAQLWLQLHRKPGRYIHVLLQAPEQLLEGSQSSRMFIHAIKRLAMKDVKQAVSLWDANKKLFNINKKDQHKIEKRLAFAMIHQGDANAYERFVGLTASDQSSRAWRVRIALSQQNWKRVITAIKALSPEQKMDERWQYWLARAYLKTGQLEAAQKLFSMLSRKRSFYGYLAADRVNSMYQLVDKPLTVSQKEVTKLKNRQDFQVAFEFSVLNFRQQARSQWWYALRKLNKKEIMVAAKLAQQWQWDEIAIFTIAKVKYWDDIEMRFPLGYSAKVHENANLQKLNPALLFGLIRRESAFNEKAYSPTGARGLMQIMPKTGRKIARHFNETWHGSKSLFNPVKNLKYGSYYYQKLLKQFDGHYALALAAYNAGSRRVEKWLPDETLPADIWIETIPFKETREYVIAVLTYTLIYQQQTDNNELTMADLTQAVNP